MKSWKYMIALVPAGLLAAMVGSSAARQEDEPAPPPDVVRRTERAITLAPTAPRAAVFQGQAVAPPAGIPGAPGVPAVETMVIRAHGPDGGLFPQQAFVMGHGPGSDKTHKAFAKLKEAESDDEKAEARAALKDALEEQFDEYLEHQSKELDRLEEKLNKLRGQWEKRRDAKDEIVSLRLKTLENEIGGLAWPSGGLGGGAWSMEIPPMGGDNFRFSVATPAVPAVIAAEGVDVVESAEEVEEVETEPEDREPRRPRRGTR
jgi:hypothetical protein